MNLEALKDSLKKHEGCKATLYTCTAGKPTIGIGHNLETPISQAAIDQILNDDIAECVKQLDAKIPSWRQHDDVRQNVLVEMAFNLGIAGLCKFVGMLAAFHRRDYEAAAREMINSKWVKQVGQRAKTLAESMRTGK